MSTPDPVPVGAAVPWYQSPVQRAQLTTAILALIALFPKAAMLIGIDSGNVGLWVEAVFAVGAFLTPLVGMWLRAKSHLQPLTLTKAAAAAHPATVAATPLAATAPESPN